MKIYISFDFEGLNGISKFSQTEITDPRSYELGLEQAKKELSSVIRGAFKAGAEKIVVNDAHCSMGNLNLNMLDERVSLITGKPKLVSMMAGLESDNFTACILVGYHAKASTSGACLAHTLCEQMISVRINKKEVGEAFLNTAYAATKNVPVAMVSGDEALTEEIHNQIGCVPTVKVKTALGMNAVICRPQAEVLEELEKTTTESLNNPTNWILNKVKSPYELEVELSQIAMADLVELIPGIKRISARKVQFTHPDFETIYKLLQAICALSATAKNYY